MKLRIADTPKPRQWPVGRELNLEEAAQLLEADAGLMALRSRMASVLVDQGFRFEIIREAGDWQPEPDDGGDDDDTGPEFTGGWKHYGRK